jgi:hypothetical protein
MNTHYCSAQRETIAALAKFAITAEWRLHSPVGTIIREESHWQSRVLRNDPC